MTDRHAGYVVVLDKNMREDDAEYVLGAIRMIKGVQQVTPIVVDNVGAAAVATLRRDNEWRESLFALVQQGPGALEVKPGVSPG